MLTLRLQAAARLIGSCRTIYDVGCDHGYLPLALLQTGQAQTACFCDISAPALEKARAHAARAGLDGRSRFVRGDGLAGLHPQASDAVSICGVGGDTALEILRSCEALPCPVVVQANSRREMLRRGLAALGYRAQAEEMLQENNRYYVLGRYERGTETLTDAQAAFGPRLLQTRPPILNAYLDYQRRVLEKAYRQAKEDPKDGARLLGALKLISEAIP